MTTRTLVAAASLVILVGAAVLLAAFYRHNDIYIPLERAHGSAADDLDAYRMSTVTASLISDIHDKHLYTVSSSVMDFALLGGNSENIMGVQMSHLVYNKDDRVVSVFFAPAHQFEIASDLQDSRVVKNNIVFFDHNCRGCRLVYHKVGSLIVITASADREIDLLEFVPGFSAI